ncbi:MotA/TolQ/ExbB proton channel family protein [Thalassospiraceae bacterium LMO-SO8]|jgi:chemotaxis protein MotA|nr:MotA/TolQ/ExbB proton channel family protein [Alphaproteobacteria bacterium LMO-S08]WND75360.1 MotA/TolQ/ExbB proton channel family protein [Thalassospiraceae bacterium LMO-SO8]HBC08643.1 flagellar motor protein MotA [Rhodospirillaceae bacterium]|tara:strand:+ start:148103 stop:148897 length:795 start_codon:yes stop_codon:yes gene_type:complete
MSFTTLVGLLAAFGLFIGSVMMSTDNFLIFLSLSSLLMVVGGTLSATFISYEPRYVMLSLRLIWRILFSPKVGRNVLKSEVGRIIRWAYTVQKSGPPALEAEAKKAVRGDKFLKFGVDMVISGYTGEEVREILTNAIESTFGRNTVQVDILRSMGGAAPAFGMIGTLVGLIIMLDNLGGDPTQLGAGLAVALLTTLYGVMFARMIFIPAATKIQQREEIVRFRNYLIAEGLSLLADKKNPRYIADRMNSFLDPAIHFNIDKMKR